jgi:hypothetical protein
VQLNELLVLLATTDAVNLRDTALSSNYEAFILAGLFGAISIA